MRIDKLFVIGAMLVGAFAFSPEEGTAAATLPDQVPEHVKAERLNRLMEAQRAVSRASSSSSR